MSVFQAVSTEYLTVRNPLFAQYDNAVVSGPSDDTHDIGHYGTYWNGTATIYTGFYRDASASGVFRLYDGLQIQPDVYNGLVNTAGLGFTAASLEIMNLTAQGYINCLAVTNSTSPTTGSVTTAGGLGVALDAWIGGLLDVKSTIHSQSIVNSTSPTTGSVTTAGGLGVALDAWIGGLLDVKSTINSQSIVNSTSPTTGSVTTAGGLGVALDAWIGGLLNVAGNLVVNGPSTQINSPTLNFADNFIPNNVASYANMKNDSGWFGARKPANVATNDTPKVPNVALTTNYTANATTITIDAVAIGSGYYVGWYLRDDTNSQYAKIVTDTDNGGNHTFILDQGFTVAGTSGTNTYSLYNKRYAGWVWDESLTELSAYGFPREDTLSILDPAATDGSAPEYIDVSVNNLNVNGSLTVTGGITASPNPIPTMTLTTAHTLTTIEITNHAVVYVNPTANITITLPLLSSLTLVNYAYRFTVINVSTFKVTLAANGTNKIESKASFDLKNKWDKQTVVTTPFSTTWFIQ